MSKSTGIALFTAAALSSFLPLALLGPAQAQTAAEAAGDLAQMLDSANTDLSSENLVSALQGAADAGQPIAMWQLGLMYESGQGVEQDQVKAFNFFAQIANENADAPPRSLDSDIVAQSFVKMGEYYRHGLPDAGIKADTHRARALVLHAASYFGDADAQYQVGQLYLDENELGVNPLQSARWLSLAARKGHLGAQAQLGQLLFEGEGIEAQPIEGLMWLSLAQRRSVGTSDESWIGEIAGQAMAVATPGERESAIRAADAFAPQFNSY